MQTYTSLQTSPPLLVLTTVADLTVTNISTIESAGTPQLRLKSLTGSVSSAIYFGDTDSLQVGKIKYTHTTDKMDFITGAQQTLSLHGDGITVSGTVLSDGANIKADDAALLIESTTNGAGTGIDFTDQIATTKQTGHFDTITLIQFLMAPAMLLYLALQKIQPLY